MIMNLLHAMNTLVVEVHSRSGEKNRISGRYDNDKNSVGARCARCWLCTQGNIERLLLVFYYVIADIE